MTLTKQEFYKRGGLSNPLLYRVKTKGQWKYFSKSKNQLKVKDRHVTKQCKFEEELL